MEVIKNEYTMFDIVSTRITEEFLWSIVAKKRDKGPTGHSSTQERQEFCEVEELDLGCKGISVIERMWEFTSLRTLHLSNNRIQKMGGLSRLTNLRSLNLSFNKIMKIEGLDSLKKLEHLNLLNNNISVLENIDPLENLISFNIANNNLKDLNQVMYLRKFKNLFELDFSGNPLSEEENYKFFVSAFFPNLKSLDYRYITAEIKKEASAIFYDDIQHLNREDAEREKKAEALKTHQAELQLHTEAFVELLNGPFLFEHMIKDDPLGDKLQCVPEVAAEQESFKEKMTELCVQLFETGLAELKRRQAEVQSFYTSHSITKAETVDKETQLLEGFEKYVKEFKKESASGLQTSKAGPKDELKKMHHNLIIMEFKLISVIERMIKILEAEMTGLITAFNKTAQDIFAQCLDEENKYHQKMQEIVAVAVDKVEKDEDDDLPEDVKLALLDKEVMGALTTAHENHILAIRDRESLLSTRANAWKNTLIKKLKEEELHRNRQVLCDFLDFVDYHEEELNKLFNR